MTAVELYDAVVSKLSVPSIHPLHKAMLEECCENALKTENLDEPTLILAVQIAFVTCDKSLRGVLKASTESFNADVVKLNYRGQSFDIERDSPFISYTE